MSAIITFLVFGKEKQQEPQKAHHRETLFKTSFLTFSLVYFTIFLEI